MKIMIIIISVAVYLIGMFVTKIVITVHDNFMSPSNRVDDFDIVFMVIWPIILPVVGLFDLFIKLYKIAENIGNKISIKLRDKGKERLIKLRRNKTMPNKYLIGTINLVADDKHSIYNSYVVEANDLLSAFAEYRNTFNLGKFEQPEMVKILPPDTPVGPYTDEKKEDLK